MDKARRCLLGRRDSKCRSRAIKKHIEKSEEFRVAGAKEMRLEG